MPLGQADLLTPDGWITVDVVDPSTARYPVIEVKTPDGWGCLPVESIANADTPIEVRTADGWRGVARTAGGVGGGGGGGDTTAAGGDGTGVGTPGFAGQIDTTLYAQADLGMDGDGNTAINSTLTNNAADATEILFEPGTYLVDPPSDNSGLSFSGLSNFSIRGDGDQRRDARFRFPSGKAGKIWKFSGTSSNIWLANFVFDQSADDNCYIEMDYVADGDLYAYNIAHVGKSAHENIAGDPASSSGDEGSGITFAASAGSTCRLENYQYTDPPVDIVDYPDNIAGLAAFPSQEGVLEVVNAHIANRGEHAMYASRTNGPVRVEAGYFHSNFNTNMRISGKGSYIRNATIHIDKPPSEQIESDTGDPKAMRGLRVEDNRGSNSDGATGGFAENVDFIKETNVQASGPLILVDGSQGKWTVTDCRIRDESTDANPAVRVDPIGAEGTTPPTPHAVVIENTSFVGSGDSTALDSARSDAPTEVTDCCLSMDGSGFTGSYQESGTVYTGCDSPSL